MCILHFVALTLESQLLIIKIDKIKLERILIENHVRKNRSYMVPLLTIYRIK